MSNEIINCVWLGSELSKMEQLCIRSYQNHGHEVHLYVSSSVAGIPAGTIIRNIEEVIPPERSKPYKHAGQYVDYVKALIAFQLGGWYVDTDTVCLRKFDFQEPYAFVSESRLESVRPLSLPPMEASRQVQTYISGCIFKAPKDAVLLHNVVKRIAAADLMNPPKDDWIVFGPKNYTELVPALGLTRYVKAPIVFDALNYNEPLHIINDVPYSFSNESYAIHWRASGWK